MEVKLAVKGFLSSASGVHGAPSLAPFASWPRELGFPSATLTWGFLCSLHFLPMVVAKVEGEIGH